MNLCLAAETPTKKNNMPPATTDTELQKELEVRLKELPKVVRDAIRSADIEKRLRSLADTHKLHLDQWGKLENEVMLALLGFQPVEDLQQNIKSEVGTSDEIAAALAADISKGVFEPIRQELERELEHPDAKAKEEGAVEGMRTQMLGEQRAENSEQKIARGEQAPEEKLPVVASPLPAPSVVSATPPPPPPTEKAVRMPASGAYKPGEASATRKDVHDDPYREPPA